MRQRFDRLAKQIITVALEAGGRVDAEYQVVGPSQTIDVWFRPDPVLADNLARAGLLGRIANHEACMIEAFRNTPGLGELEACMCKQHVLAHENALAAKQAEQPRPGLPRLWVVSSGRPDQVIDAFELAPMPGWPAGCYGTRLEILQLFLIVVRELPVTRDTLLLRLVGRGPTFRQAMAELAALPPDAWEKQRVQPLLIALAFKIPQNPEVDMEAREYLQEARAIYAEIEQQIRAEGRVEGRVEGLEEGERTLLRKQLTLRFGALPADILARVDSATTEQIERWGERVLTATTLVDVFGD